MTEKIELETVGEIIREEFIIPILKTKHILFFDFMQQFYREEISEMYKRLFDFLDNSNELDKELDKKLCDYFNLSQGYFLRLQEDLKKRLDK